MLEKHGRKETNNFPCIFRYVTPGMCLISMDELPFTFPPPVLKLTHRSKWVFTLFPGTRGHFITVPINTVDVPRFIFRGADYLNWLTTDILQLFSVMQIQKLWEFAKGIIFKVFTPASSNLGCRRAGGGGPQVATWPFERWHFIRTIFSCEHGWVQAVSGSIVSCVHMCREVSALPYKLHSPSPFHLITSCVPLSLAHCGSLMHPHDHKYRI